MSRRRRAKVVDDTARQHLAVCVVTGPGGARLHKLRLSQSDIERLSVQSYEPEAVHIVLEMASEALLDEVT